jgi:predicted amidohydrolase YtcJ
METAVTRKAVDGFVIGKNQRITLEQALHAYTVGSAVADNLNDVKGSLSIGKYADFIVLNLNPLVLDDVSVVKTEETWINGKLNYKK